MARSPFRKSERSPRRGSGGRDQESRNWREKYDECYRRGLNRSAEDRGRRDHDRRFSPEQTPSSSIKTPMKRKNEGAPYKLEKPKKRKIKVETVTDDEEDDD